MLSRSLALVLKLMACECEVGPETVYSLEEAGHAPEATEMIQP